MQQQETANLGDQQRGWAWVPEGGVARTILELLIIVPAYALYSLVRGTVDGRTSVAFAHATKVVDLERSLHIFWETDLQSVALTSGIVEKMADTMYVWGHLPLLICVAIWIFAFHRQRYPLFRNAFLISGAIALFFFWLVPVAPPRYLQYWGFVDTAAHAASYSILQPPEFVNQYAAMPSLHIAWSLLAAIAIVVNTQSRWRYVAFLLPVLMLGGVVLTANHFFLDAVAGGVVALMGLGIAYLLRAYLPRNKPFSILT